MLAITFVISVVVQRTLPLRLLIVQSLVYFTPAYLFGIYCSLNKANVYSFFRAKEYLFLIPFLVILLAQTQLGIVGNNNKSFFSYEGIDFLLPQKIFLCLFLMVWLHRFEGFNNKYILLLAKTSFAIYFLHGYVLKLLYILKEQLGIEQFTQPILAFIIGLILLVSISMLFAILIKSILKINHRI